MQERGGCALRVDGQLRWKPPDEAGANWRSRSDLFGPAMASRSSDESQREIPDVAPAIALPAPYRPGQAGAVRVAGQSSARTGPAAFPGQSPSLRPKVMRYDSQCAGGQGQDEKGTPISGGGWQSRCQAGGPTGRGRGRVHQRPDNYRGQIGAGRPAPPVAENGCRCRSRQYEVECDN